MIALLFDHAPASSNVTTAQQQARPLAAPLRPPPAAARPLAGAQPRAVGAGARGGGAQTCLGAPRTPTPSPCGAPLARGGRRGAVAPGTADKRRELYLIRHADNAIKVGTPGYYAAKILWS